MASISPPPPVARVRSLTLRYGETVALDDIDLALRAGGVIGVVGPDGVGKSSLLALIAGARRLQRGTVEVLGGDMARGRWRAQICPRIAYMPQGLGRNLYATLSVQENVDYFGRLFGLPAAARAARTDVLLDATGLAPFASRPAGKLSGGMKQKLGLCCALIHDPDLMVLDEPTTGVDPLSRRQFWELIAHIRASRAGMSVLVATSYMEEAARFDWLVVMHAGRVLATGTPAELLARTGTSTLDDAFIALLPEAARRDHRPVTVTARTTSADAPSAIEARDLTVRFGDFTAVDRVSFRIPRGEIFGFLGSNGCGKTTTMKLLTGLLPASAGEAKLFGRAVDPGDLAVRRRVGYMSQSFSLYGELSVRGNLELHARLFGLPAAAIAARVEALAARFGLSPHMDALPNALPLGTRQRLSLAVALIHGPELLILDEPTSGVDPVARDAFWHTLLALAREEHVTIFISTHYMSEAERCDRISFMHAGRVLVSDTPAALIAGCGAATLEEAFIHHLEEAEARARAPLEADAAAPALAARTGPTSGSAARAEETRARSEAPRSPARGIAARLVRLRAQSRREALELARDPMRLTMAALGSIILLFVLGYGISFDVENLRYAVLDHDDTPASRDYQLDLAGSRYFLDQRPLRDQADLDRRMRSAQISLAIEIPPGFGRDLARGQAVTVGAWFDGAMPTRGETIRNYVQGIHAHWLARRARESGVAHAAPMRIETRFRYNPDVKSLMAMVPAVIPLLLILVPAMLTALSVVREKELGSILNFYVTPMRPLEFLVGKQLPYIALGMVNFAVLAVLAVTVFGVPLTGSVLTLAAATLLYVGAATAFGLLVSSFVRSQMAAIFGTAALTILPAVEFSGMIDPVASLDGVGRAVGTVFPTTYFLIVARGTFSKGLDFAGVAPAFPPIALAAIVLVTLAAGLLRKQER